MKHHIKPLLRTIAHGPLEPVFFLLWDILARIQLFRLPLIWKLTKQPMPTPEQQKLVAENVTFLFKSFQRQPMAKRLYRNIRHYYPDARVIIADDSKVPLDLEGEGLTVLHLPFNSGLSKGLNAALAQVQTPFVARMDDDELLTPFSRFHQHLVFLQEHPEVDLVGVLPRNIPFGGDWKQQKNAYFAQPMAHALKPLKIPHMTWLDKDHVVLGKVPNIFLARTEAYRALGYDDRIRMIDHQDFFFRAAGNLVSVLAPDSFVLHYHNRFNRSYQQFREDVEGDRRYISQKYAALMYYSHLKNAQNKTDRSEQETGR